MALPKLKITKERINLLDCKTSVELWSPSLGFGQIGLGGKAGGGDALMNPPSESLLQSFPIRVASCNSN